MGYEKNPTWQNGIGGGTAITAPKLNHIEDGLEAAAAIADTAQTTAEEALEAAEGGSGLDPDTNPNHYFCRNTSAGTPINVVASTVEDITDLLNSDCTPGSPPDWLPVWFPGDMDIPTPGLIFETPGLFYVEYLIKLHSTDPTWFRFTAGLDDGAVGEFQDEGNSRGGSFNEFFKTGQVLYYGANQKLLGWSIEATTEDLVVDEFRLRAIKVG